MQRAERCNDKPNRERPRLEVADVFRTHGAAYRRRYVLTPEQHRVLQSLMACRTELLGGHLDICDRGGHTEPSYNSCRNRHCPKCQSAEQARWVLQRMERILPVDYFHVVFTVPGELQPIARRNASAFYALLFKAAAETLQILARDESRLGAILGVTAVLHTWTRKLHYHPHVHCLVTGGGLSLDGTAWVSPRYPGKFLFPVHVLSKFFRGKLLALLDRAVADGGIDLGGTDEEIERQAFDALKDRVYRKKWVVYAKRPFAGPKQVFRYLGMYTHRVGISNYRLQAMEGDQVTFSTKEGGTETVSGVEFIRRFLLHLLPRGFRKIRHYGLHAPSNVSTNLEVARELLEATRSSSGVDSQAPDPWEDFVQALTSDDPPPCPKCREGVLIRHVVDPRTGEPVLALPEPDT